MIEDDEITCSFLSFRENLFRVRGFRGEAGGLNGKKKGD